MKKILLIILILLFSCSSDDVKPCSGCTTTIYEDGVLIGTDLCEFFKSYPKNFNKEYTIMVESCDGQNYYGKYFLSQ